MQDLPPLASVAAFEKRLGLSPGALQGADLARAEAALEDASALVRDEAGRSWVDEDGAVTAPPAVVTVTLKAARREYVNPNGYTSEQTGPFSYQLPRGETGVYLTEAERRIVRRTAGKFGMGTIATPSAYTDPLPLPTGTRLPKTPPFWED